VTAVAVRLICSWAAPGHKSLLEPTKLGSGKFQDTSDCLSQLSLDPGSSRTQVTAWAN